MISIVNPGGDPEANFESLDFSGCQFPSDALSIGVLRKQHPKLFDKGFDSGGDNAQPKFFLQPDNAGHAEDVVAGMLYSERFIATAAYAAQMGLKGPWGDVGELKEELQELYCRYGIAKGAHHADELIRDIERQGAELATDRRR